MDKVVRRTAQAVRQAQRKARIQAERDASLARKDYFRNLAQRQRIFIDARKNQRNEFRENWFKGPIAPLRDAGDRTGVYGAAGLAVYHQPVVPKPDRRKFITIAAGDYVVIVKGRDKGLIDKVATVSVETESVTLHNLNKYELEIPEPLIDAQSPYATQNHPTPLPLDHIRLVMPLYDPKTGKTQDTIIESVRAAGPRQERPVGSPLPTYTRYIDGTDIELPWPSTAQTPKYEREQIDTPRVVVDKHTFIPPMNDFPFPASVMDELRNKFSTFRDRHEPEYLASKQEETVHEAYLRERNLLTPKAEHLRNLAESRQKAREADITDADGNLRLPQSSVTFIREFMESKQKPAEK